MEKRAKKILYTGVLSVLLANACMKEMSQRQASENVGLTIEEGQVTDKIAIIDANNEAYFTNDVKMLTFIIAEETYQNLYVYKIKSSKDYDIYKSVTNPSIELVRNKTKLEDQYQIISTKCEINCEEWEVYMVVTALVPSILDYELSLEEEEKLNYHMNKVITSQNLSLIK